MMTLAPTWIDTGLALEWLNGCVARHDITTRWFVSFDESRAGFVMMSGNAGHGSFGGDDTVYTAEEIASAIERWATLASGLEACPLFLEALEHHARRANAKGTQLEIIRAKYLIDAMRARIAIAQAEDAPSFAGFKGCQTADYDGEGTAVVLPWEAGHDH
jgi:hypothetical protein